MPGRREGVFAGQGFGQRQAQAVHVGGGRGGGAGIVQLAGAVPQGHSVFLDGGGQHGKLVAAGRPEKGAAEIAQQRGPGGGQKNVVGAHVAVVHMGGVGGLQALGHVAHQHQLLG